MDLKTPLPEYDERAFACSPVPTQTICEFDGATATAPTAATSTLSEIGVPGDAVVDRLPQAAGPRRGVDRVEVIARRRVRHGDLGDPRRGRNGPMLRNVSRVEDVVERSAFCSADSGTHAAAPASRIKPSLCQRFVATLTRPPGISGA